MPVFLAYTNINPDEEDRDCYGRVSYRYLIFFLFGGLINVTCIVDPETDQEQLYKTLTEKLESLNETPIGE